LVNNFPVKISRFFTSLAKRLENPHIFLIVSNSGWLLFDKIIRIILAILVGAWVARFLGPTSYGQLSYALTFITLFQVIASLGADNIIVRDLIVDRNHANTTLGTIFVLRIVVGFITWLFALLVVLIINGPNDKVVILTAIAGTILIFQAADTIDLWFQSQNKNKKTVIAKLGAYVISNGIKIFLILNNAPLTAFALVLSIDSFFAAIGLFIVYRTFPVGAKWKFEFKRVKNLLHDSWTFMISGLSLMLYMRIDQLLLKSMLGSKDLGIYSAALTFSSFLPIIPMTLFTVLSPFIIEKRKQGPLVYWKALSVVFRLYAGLGIILCLLTLLSSSFLISMLYGPAYTSSIKILCIHVLTNIFIFIGIAQNFWIINENKGNLNLIKTLVGLGVALLGNLILIPVWGLYGAAITAVIVQAVSSFFINIILAPKIFKLQLLSLFQIPLKGY